MARHSQTSAAQFPRIWGQKGKAHPDNSRDGLLIYPGGDLLSRKLYRHYHRPCSVSRPGSEWDRVGPLRQSHQEILARSQTKEQEFADNYIQEWFKYNVAEVFVKSPFFPLAREIQVIKPHG